MKHRKEIIVAMVAALTAFAFACSAGTGIAAVPKDAFIVDVRTPEEYNSGHFPGATNIPLDTVKDRLDLFGAKDQPIVLYCRSGHRASIALKILKDAGYTDVQNAGGLRQIMALKK